VAAVFYPLFGLLDLLIYSEHFALFVWIRLGMFGLFVTLALIVQKARDYRRVVRATATGYVIPTCCIALMCYVTEGIRSPYYAGIALSTVFVAAFLTWPVSVTVKSTALVLGMYFLPLAGDLVADSRYALLHGAFLFGTTLLVWLGMRLRNLQAWHVYSSELALFQRNKELAELHELKDRMFQNVSHELRTPLTLMLTPLQRQLEDETASRDQRRWTEEMYRNGMRLLKRIDDLLDLASLDADSVTVDKRPVEVTSLMRSLVDDVRNSARAGELTVELEAPAEEVYYLLDPHHVERIVLNLLANALKFTPSGGVIVVSVADDSQGLAISIADTGPGIPTVEQERVFDRFRQLDSGATRRFSGSGIGLALVSELTKLMGGRVELESEEGRGSSFTVRFPIEANIGRGEKDTSARDAGGVEGLHRLAQREALQLEVGTGNRMVAGARGPRVLIVEDDDSLRRHLVEVLSRGHRVVAVAGGEEGLREALLFRPQVVISDVMMPGMDGVELCRRIRERSELKETAVVLLTAKGRLEDRIEGRRVGADSYLAKPFHFRELLATIEGLLRSRMHLVGEYLLQAPLGKGGQSEVWLAVHRESGERAALKVIRPGGLEDARARARLRREHQTLLKLSHPNIVRMVERGEQAGGLYLAMEYLEGVTLDQLVRACGPLPFGAVAAIGRSTASALAHVHESGLVHRDVKCSNLMLLENENRLAERVRLIDFGTAAAVAPRSSGAATGRVVGSLPYLAPELLRGAAEASSASDIYGLGVVLYRLATGHLPYLGTTLGDLEAAIAEDSLERIDQVSPGVPADVGEIIHRAMATNPENRWASAEELKLFLTPHVDESVPLTVPSVKGPSAATATFRPAETGTSATRGS